ncbi:4-alpha-glucanotransferase [Roseibacterium sp. SDUM158017]|uniref:4-alpha-glucanotransferase n=1 Tax=Roseicyclus salinarum TaxID=3036773 RepID=UPI0024156AD1|nr:4-alpha-glucanotransferase [Roseibacterium sp. SDUM158017]MDG4648890.1 4-alpha-glucanotransferase [Roseibacterium sp. SDUM158017]
MSDPLEALAARAGIVASYTDQTRRRRRTGRGTMRALLAAMRLPARTDAEAAECLAALEAEADARALPEWTVQEPGMPPRGLVPEGASWRLVREDGTTEEGRGDSLPALPLGLHTLGLDGSDCTLIVAPRRLPLPRSVWGMMLPLHALRPAQTGGLADYDDLAAAAEGLAGQGADFIGLNPIHAGFFADPGAFSPYTPSHRRRLSAFHVADGAPSDPSGPLVDYAVEIPRRRAALDATFARFRASGGDPAFDAFRAGEGAALERFALHQALSDRHGPYWRDWPADLHDPAGEAASRAAIELSDAVSFHAWAQWRAHDGLAQANAQARGAGMSMGLYLDLAVGTHPSGAETWEDRDSFAFGASLGAPPDAFSADGQSWGLAPFNPRALVASGFRPLAETLRCQMSLSGAVRIDHILGFDRAFWAPERGGPGAYVRMPREAMLAVVRLEAARAGAVVVGEDLGNVPRGLRGALDASGILGCRLQLFERMPTRKPAFRPPGQYEARSIASFSTHDLPTWLGWRRGHDIEARAALGHIDQDFAAAEMGRRKAEVAAFDTMTARLAPDGTDPASADAMHHALAAAGSALAMVQVECALDIVPQPNLPGTIDEYPNWRQRLPVAPDALAGHPGVRRAARIMKARG